MAYTYYKKPFVQTHKRKKDGMVAMLLATMGDDVLYRVRYSAAAGQVDSTIRASARHFKRKFTLVKESAA